MPKVVDVRAPVSPPPVRDVRAVWACVSRHPRAPIAAIGSMLGLSIGMTWRALQALRDAGYIDFDDGAIGARRILVPFIVTRKARQ